MDYMQIFLGMVGGLALFLYGVTRLSISLRKLAGDKMKKLLERFTNNIFVSILSGTIATILLDSSSVTIIMIIALVNVGLITFSRAIGVIMGANIGTTFSSQLIAFQIDHYSSILLLAGFILYFISKKKMTKYIGLVLFGFGLIFFGLGLIGEAAEPLKNSVAITSWLHSLENPLKGVLVGSVITAVIQSSSATMGIVITMAGQGIISLAAGVTVMLGAEIGTCADTLIASIGRSREAIRAGVFHLVFNVTTVLIGALLYKPLAEIASMISPGDNIARQIANAHVIFNIGGVLLLVWFVTPIASFLERIIPDKPSRGLITV
jgi:phosphate:Na+ symporter